MEILLLDRLLEDWSNCHGDLAISQLQLLKSAHAVHPVDCVACGSILRVVILVQLVLVVHLLDRLIVVSATQVPVHCLLLGARSRCGDFLIILVKHVGNRLDLLKVLLWIAIFDLKFALIQIGLAPTVADGLPSHLLAIVQLI